MSDTSFDSRWVARRHYRLLHTRPHIVYLSEVARDMRTTEGRDLPKVVTSNQRSKDTLSLLSKRREK